MNPNQTHAVLSVGGILSIEGWSACEFCIESDCGRVGCRTLSATVGNV